ncbi:MAG: hypothetical protein ACQEU4_05300 [Bacillota bacterium]
MNTNQSTALMDRVSEILASLGDSSDVKSRYLQLTGGAFFCLSPLYRWHCGYRVYPGTYHRTFITSACT